MDSFLYLAYMSVLLITVMTILVAIISLIHIREPNLILRTKSEVQKWDHRTVGREKITGFEKKRSQSFSAGHEVHICRLKLP